MKILHYINNLGSGGAEKLLTDILPLMKQQGNEVHLAYSNGRKNVSGFDETIKEAEIRVINLDQSFYNPFQIFKLIFLLRKERYDIVHAHIFPSQYWLAIASLFKPYRTRIFKTEHSVYNRRRKVKLFIIIEKWIYSRYERIIAISPAVKEKLIEWLGGNNHISLIVNGINLNQMERMKGINLITENSFYQPDFFNILMVGRFNYEKDQGSLVKALAYLPDHYILFFAGDGNNLTQIKSLVSDLNLQNRVHFLGVRPDVYFLMSRADLNVLSTNHEGLSGVALESMASGRPFIGTDVAGVNDVVPDATFLFPKADPECLADKIREVAENMDKQRDLIRKGLEHVKKYDISFMADNYLELYRNCLNDGNQMFLNRI